MQVSSSVSSPLISGVSNKLSAPIKNSVRSADPVSEIEQNQSSNKQAVPSIVIDEQAIALYQQSQSSAQLPVQSKQEGSSSASQDQPSAKNETAVASYQTVSNLAKRESVQQLFGVDLFA